MLKWLGVGILAAALIAGFLLLLNSSGPQNTPAPPEDE
jgi:hypothetical protein